MFMRRVLPSFLPVRPESRQDSEHQPDISTLTIDRINILLKHGTIPLPLHLCKANVDIDLLFCTMLSEKQLIHEEDNILGSSDFSTSALTRRSREGSKDLVKRASTTTLLASSSDMFSLSPL